MKHLAGPFDPGLRAIAAQPVKHMAPGVKDQRGYRRKVEERPLSASRLSKTSFEEDHFMARTHRIARINALLSRPQGASMAQLMEELEVSRATVNRDLQTLRDRMNTPIVWDRYRGIYRIEPNGNAGPTYMVPGLWLTPAQAYATLTLNNMVEKIAPNVLGPFLMPMRGLLKQLLGEADFPLHGLDRKIEIDMPAMPAIGDLDFANLVEALIQEQPARFVIRNKAGLEHTLSGTPLKLRITASGWSIQVRHRSAPEPLTVDVADIRKVMAATEIDE